MGADPARIEPRLSAFDTTMVVVSLVIGIGIFRTPAIVAGATGSSALFFAAWLLGGAVSLAGALTYAEIGSRFPRAGGYYKVVAFCYHPALAFMLNWSQALLQGAGAAGVAFIGAEHLNLLLLAPERRTPGAVATSAVALMLVLLATNLAGIRAGARTQNLLSLSKVVLILGLAAAGLLWAARPAPGIAAVPAGSWSGMAAACVAVFYAYGGYQNAMNLGADVRDPRRSLPLGVTAGMGLVVALYLLINVAYLRGLGVSGVARESLVAAALARAALGPAGEAVVALAIFLSAAGFVNATILQLPRSYYAMAQDGALPPVFLRVSASRGVQDAGLLLVAATMLLPSLLLGTFEKLLSYVMFSDALMLVTVASTVFVLRRQGVGAAEASQAPGRGLLPGTFIACLLAVAAQVAVSEPRLALAGTGILLAGYPLFRLARRASA